MTDQEFNPESGRPDVRRETVRFPDALVEEPEILQADFDRRGNAALQQLAERGYDMALGLNEYYAGAISVMSQQPHIVEYCPQDATEARFASRASTERWLKKRTGRAVFLLLRRGQNGTDSRRLAGYGWSGLGAEPASAEYPIDVACRIGASAEDEYPITTAFRIGAEDLGRKLFKDFVQVVVSATHARFGGGLGIGLETWRSNPAFKTYKQLGFILLESLSPDEREWRPTLDPFAVDGVEADRRVRMGYPKHLPD